MIHEADWVQNQFKVTKLLADKAMKQTIISDLFTNKGYRQRLDLLNFFTSHSFELLESFWFLIFGEFSVYRD